LAGTGWLSESLPWEHHGRGWIARTWQLVRSLRRERLDAMLILRNSGFAAAVARLGGAQRTIGYARRASRWFLTTRLAAPRSGGKFAPISAVDYYLELAYAAGCHEERRQLELATMPADERAADAIWDSLSLPDPRRVVLINVGGAYGSAKHWPREHAIELSRRLAGELELTVLILCGPTERAAAAALARDADHPRVLSLAGEDVSFGPTKAVIRRARLLVSTDSGPRHIAAALGTPTITLFGPIDPRWSENYQPGAVHLRLPLECSPCGRRACPLGHHRCMRELSVDMALHAVERRLTAESRFAA
jgi:heptosyltransferase-2